MGFPTKNDHFGVFWGHLRKPPINLRSQLGTSPFQQGKLLQALAKSGPLREPARFVPMHLEAPSFVFWENSLMWTRYLTLKLVQLILVILIRISYLQIIDRPEMDEMEYSSWPNLGFQTGTLSLRRHMVNIPWLWNSFKRCQSFGWILPINHTRGGYPGRAHSQKSMCVYAVIYSTATQKQNRQNSLHPSRWSTHSMQRIWGGGSLMLEQVQWQTDIVLSYSSKLFNIFQY